MKTPSQRKAAQRERDRAAGLVEVLVKIPADRKTDLLAFVATLSHATKPPAY